MRVVISARGPVRRICIFGVTSEPAAQHRAHVFALDFFAPGRIGSARLGGHLWKRGNCVTSASCAISARAPPSDPLIRIRRFPPSLASGCSISQRRSSNSRRIAMRRVAPPVSPKRTSRMKVASTSLSFASPSKTCSKTVSAGPSERALYSSNRCVGLKQIALLLVAAPPRFRERKLQRAKSPGRSPTSCKTLLASASRSPSFTPASLSGSVMTRCRSSSRMRPRR
jgi:hypothetical protein